MRYRVFGRTGLQISAIALGAGPVSGLMTGGDRDAQIAVLQRALELGINWIDTAPGYGHGQSETNIGEALQSIGASDKFHLATKVRLSAEGLTNTSDAVRRSVEQSLQRLGIPFITLLQLHNGLTERRDDEPFSITPADVLDPGGVLECFQKLKEDGLIRFLGLTGTGQPSALREVVRSGGFDAMQTPYHLLNPSAGQNMPDDFSETNYGNIIADCAAMQMGVLAIRVFAGGALLGNPPSAHTLKTPFFPLALYEQDLQRAIGLQQNFNGSLTLKEVALRIALGHSQIHSAIIGFGKPEHVDEAVAFAERGGISILAHGASN
jgi:aryl-alcohol dehydrogenase-like predicted oxidoreductase